MHFPVSHVEGPMDISLKRNTNPFHPLMSLYIIYSISNNSLYYHPITNDVELCRAPHVGTYGGVRSKDKKEDIIMMRITHD